MKINSLDCGKSRGKYKRSGRLWVLVFAGARGRMKTE